MASPCPMLPRSDDPLESPRIAKKLTFYHVNRLGLYLREQYLMHAEFFVLFLLATSIYLCR